MGQILGTLCIIAEDVKRLTAAMSEGQHKQNRQSWPLTGVDNIRWWDFLFVQLCFYGCCHSCSVSYSGQENNFSKLLFDIDDSTYLDPKLNETMENQ